MSISDAEVTGALQISPAGSFDAELCSHKQQANSDVQIPHIFRRKTLQIDIFNFSYYKRYTDSVENQLKIEKFFSTAIFGFECGS